MRITFFGSSHGYPEPNRRCSSAMVEACGKRILIDIGCNVTEDLISRGMALDSIDAIFITHMHGDHAHGLIPYLDICSWRFKTADPEIFLPHDVKTVYDCAYAWVKVNGVELREFKMSEINEGVIYDDGQIKVTAFKTLHIDKSYAFLIEAEGKRVFFSGDLCHRGPEHDFPLCILDTPLDLAVCEVAHFDAYKYVELFAGKEDNIKRLCFNHFSARRIKSVYDVKDTIKIPVTVAYDGMQIQL